MRTVKIHVSHFMISFHMELQVNISVSATLQKFPSNETGWAILTDIQTKIFDIVNFVFLSSIIGWLGIVANVINILVFSRQGLKNTVNISLLGLALADLCSLVTLEWICICRNPLVADADVPWVLSDFMNLTGAWPHVVCGRISSFITVYITAERCLCIIAPLKVKQIVTPARTTVAVCFIYLLNILTLVPEYATAYLGWKFYPNINKTLLSLSYTADRSSVGGLVFFLSSVLGMISFGAVAIFTFILVIKLKQTSEWRKRAVSGKTQSESTVRRENKTVKMIVVIASTLIICYSPGTCLTLTTFIEPEFNLRRRYINLAISLWSTAFVFQTVNSSVNIILYYSMSSYYRVTFHELLGKWSM